MRTHGIGTSCLVDYYRRSIHRHNLIAIHRSTQLGKGGQLEILSLFWRDLIDSCGWSGSIEIIHSKNQLRRETEHTTTVNQC